MRIRAFERVLAAETVSNFGAMLSRVVIPWLAALQLQATPLQMAGLLVADVAAAALGALLLGSLVDRSGKRAVMRVADAARCLVLGLLALAAWRGALTLPLLVAAAAASGVLTMGFELARSAWMAQQVAPADLPRRNAQLSVAGSLSETAAFALGGWLYQGLGAVLALACDAISYAASALCLWGVPEVAGEPRSAVAKPRAAMRRLWHDAADGLRAVAARPALRALAGIDALMAFGGALSGTSYMIFVSRDLALATGPLGVVFALGGIGAVMGASLAPWLGRRAGPGRTMVVGLATAAVGGVFVAGAAGSGWVLLGWLAAQQIVGDAGHALHDVHDRTLRQTAVPAALRARADAGIRSAGQLATLAGAAVGGALGNTFGARTVLWLAVFSTLTAAAVAAWRLAERRAAPAGPAAAVDPGKRS